MSCIIQQEFLRVMPTVDFLEEYDVHHNYAKKQKVYDKDYGYIHRKGATSAELDEIGIIPGSMGTSSFIVRGLGNPASLCSCSHGAGRKMSRTKAVEGLDLETEKSFMDAQGIVHGLTCKSALEEAPHAYKDINEVMENQKDLVEPLVELKTLGVIKG